MSYTARGPRRILRWTCASSAYRALEMGGSESGHLHLQLDSPNIQAGMPVTGTIYLSVTKSIAAESVCLKLTGKEGCTWERDDGENINGHGRDISRFQGKNTVVREVFPVFMFQGGQVASGQYSFPFRFNTGTTLPGSFEFEQGHIHAVIRYSLSAFLQSKVKVHRCKVDLGVSAALTHTITAVSESKVSKVTTWCCVGKGRVGLAVSVNKDAYVPGETAEIGVNIDNSESRLEVLGVTGTLFRVIRLRDTHGHSFTLKTEVNRARVHRPIHPGARCEGASQVRLSLPVFDQSGQFRSAATVRGECVECIYTLSLKSEMNGFLMCCGKPPALDHELTVYPPQLAPVQPPPIPQGWNPVIMPVANCSGKPEAVPADEVTQITYGY